VRIGLGAFAALLAGILPLPGGSAAGMESPPQPVAAGVAWSGTGAAPEAPGSLPSSRQELEATARRVAALWGAGNADGLLGLLSSDGVRVTLGRSAHSNVSPRQAVAAVKDFISGHRSENSRVTRVQEVGGSPARGFAEVLWNTYAQDTSEPLSMTLYLGFVQEGGNWRVSEIRLLR